MSIGRRGRQPLWLLEVLPQCLELPLAHAGHGQDVRVARRADRAQGAQVLEQRLPRLGADAMDAIELRLGEVRIVLPPSITNERIADLVVALERRVESTR